MSQHIDPPMNQSSIVDNLTTDDGTKALSAKQGKNLKDQIPEVVNNLTSNSTTSALSAAQGKALNSNMHSSTNITLSVIDNTKVQLSSYNAKAYNNVKVINFTCKALVNISAWENVLNSSFHPNDATNFVGQANYVPTVGTISTNGNINFATVISANQYFSGSITYITATS